MTDQIQKKKRRTKAEIEAAKVLADSKPKTPAKPKGPAKPKPPVNPRKRKQVMQAESFPFPMSPPPEPPVVVKAVEPPTVVEPKVAKVTYEMVSKQLEEEAYIPPKKSWWQKLKENVKEIF